MINTSFDPKKYWNVDDARIEFLNDFLGKCEFDLSSTYTDEQIVKTCIQTVKGSPLSNDEKQLLKTVMLKNQERNFIYLADKIVENIKTNDKIRFVSVGCGNRSFFEEILNTQIKKSNPSMEVVWLGLDVGDYRDDNSFLNESGFKVIPQDVDTYFSFVDEKEVETYLVGVYSFHHIGIDYEKFLSKCFGFKKVFLVEEPTTSALWSNLDYRIMRIAFDVLANTVFVLDWAEEFIDNPELFKVNYIKSDMVNVGTEFVFVEKEMPELSLVTTTL